jgi:hypothetical protein
MAVLNKSDIPRPVRPKQTVECASLGGEVVVQGLLMSEQFELSSKEFPRFGHLSHVLSKCIVDAEGKPVFTVEEWEAWGASHVDAVLELFKTARRVSKMEPEETT